MIEPGQNTIIEGHRGSGKSWLLRYLSMKLSESADSLAFYIKCRPEAFLTAVREGKADLEWLRFFQHYFNLYLLSNICELLQDTIHLNHEDDLLKSLLVLFQGNLGDVSSITDLVDWLYSEMDKCTAGYYSKITYTGPNHIYRFFGKLRRYNQFKNVFILLDEYENLSDEQQKVVNIYLRGRNAPPHYDFNLNFKVGLKSGCMCYKDLSGKLLRLDHDYSHVSLDKFTKEEKDDYIQFSKKVAERRLEKEGYNITDIEELLPALTYEGIEEPGYIGKDYSGFKNYVYLSSGIVRDFVSLVKDTLYFSYPEIAFKKVELKPISPKAQNHVIKMKSAMHYRHHEEDIREPEKVKRLIDTLGELFRSIQKLSIQDYNKKVEEGRDPMKEKDSIRRTSQIGIETTSTGIDPFLVEILNQAVEVQLLQVPLLPRQPQESSKSPYKNYKFHRLLAPYFSLAIQNRHPRNIKAEIFNYILRNPDKFLEVLMKNWEGYIPPSQTTLEYDWGDI